MLGVRIIDQFSPEMAGTLICCGAWKQQLQNRPNQHIEGGSSEAEEATQEALAEVAEATTAVATGTTIADGVAAVGEGILADL